MSTALEGRGVRFAVWTVGVMAVLVGFYGLSYLVRGVAGFPPGVRDNAAGGLGLMTHVTASGVAIVAAPWQLVAPWRYSTRKPHRWIGRVYVIACMLGGVSGVALAIGTATGPVARYGFLFLAIAWMTTTLLGFTSARRRDFTGHRRWMIRSFALTFAAVTLRIYLPLSQVAGLDFLAAYAAISWLCWLPNLVVAELWLRSHPGMTSTS